MADASREPRTDRADDEIAHPIFAAVYDAALPLENRLFGPHREYLAAGLSGRVLDLGAGSGAMFEYVAEAAGEGSGADLTYHAVEPDPHMRRRAAERARETGLAVHLEEGRAEALPYDDGSFDVVISAVVFCTVQDPAAGLDEVARVLKPGGEFRFFEHVGADGWRRRGQELLNPLWRRAAAGCHLDRDTVDRFVAHDAFEVIELERTDLGTFPAAPVVRGRLRRRRDGSLLG
ncbi:class I SAM-dependent methyltransferase [Halovivax sp.]|uniref:class I SAM-dependent methyltransferase n=1 Tax=Halovivax sp. TaxID=1935978 RepID=UPI0025BF4E65|nr:class I SAM-dependent methyltransferase [Halovivax sp.]